jgi:hypothetical protein
MSRKNAPSEVADQFVVIDQQYVGGSFDAGHVAVVSKLRSQPPDIMNMSGRA